MKTVIVADDSMIIQNLVSRVLASEYNVVKASDGQEAIKEVLNNKDNLVGVLLDLNMPKFDGFYVLDYFKANDFFTTYPIAIISGDESEETIKKAFTYDIVDMLNKPFDHKNVKDIVKKLEQYKK